MTQHQRRYLFNTLMLIFSLIPVSAHSTDLNIGILVYDNVLSSDVTAPAEVFGIATKKSWFKDYNVILINVDKADTITTEEGLTLKVDHTIYNAPKIDVLLVPSAYEMEHLINNQNLTHFLQEQNKTVSWLTSNCSGAFLLANAGLLDGIKATTYFGGERKLQKTFPKVKVVHDTNVVIDGRVITSNGSLISYQAALILLAKISGLEKAKTVFDALQMERLTQWQDIVDLYQS